MKQYTTPFAALLLIEAEDILTLSNGIDAMSIGDVWSFNDDFVDIT